MSDGGRVWIWKGNFDGAVERLIYLQEKEQQDILLHKVRIECRICLLAGTWELCHIFGKVGFRAGLKQRKLCLRPALYGWTLQNLQGLFHPVHQVVHWQIEEAVFLVPPLGLNII